MQQEEIKFEELLETVKTVNSKDKTRLLGQCINDELTELLQKVNEYKKGAELNIKITIMQGDRNELNILADISKKVPKGKIKQNVFYQDSKGSLYMDDPSQLKLIDARKVESINERKAYND
ncbi:MAG: hypothetical protein WCK67_08060 [bacterium]